MIHKDEISNIDAICSKLNLNLTFLRKSVFRIILEHKIPIKAYDILELLKQNYPAAKPPTVYRALDFLLENGIIHKLHNSNSYMICAHPARHAQCYFMICTKCGQISECCNSDLTKLITEIAESKQFKAQNIIIEIDGLCQDCS